MGFFIASEIFMPAIILPVTREPTLTQHEVVEYLTRFVDMARAYEKDSGVLMDAKDLHEAGYQGYRMALEQRSALTTAANPMERPLLDMDQVVDLGARFVALVRNVERDGYQPLDADDIGELAQESYRIALQSLGKVGHAA